MGITQGLSPFLYAACGRVCRHYFADHEFRVGLGIFRPVLRQLPARFFNREQARHGVHFFPAVEIQGADTVIRRIAVFTV